MKKIKGFDLRGLNNGAHFQFMKAVTEQLATETEINKNAVAKAAVEALAAKFKAEDECLSISQKNAESDAIAENDALRDALFMGYKKAVGSYVKFPVAEKAKASKTLMQRIKDYKIDPDMQLERETGLITNLVADCEGKDAAAVALLNLTDYVAQLKAANAKVESLTHWYRWVWPRASTRLSSTSTKPSRAMSRRCCRRKSLRTIRNQETVSQAMGRNRVTRNRATAGRLPMARSRAVMLQNQAAVAMARINPTAVKISRAEKVRAMLR